MKQFSQACENNREPILAVLLEAFADRRRVLEIGSGTGQHAAFFAPRMSHLRWHPTDLAENHASIAAWSQESGAANIEPPALLDITARPWPAALVGGVDAVFTANTLHIVSWPLVEMLVEEVGASLDEGGLFCVYGPFNYGGSYTSESNERFDAWLKDRDAASGIRDFEAVDALAAAQSMALLKDHAMPANNRTLIWRKNSARAAV